MGSFISLKDINDLEENLLIKKNEKKKIIYLYNITLIINLILILIFSFFFKIYF